jgi:predicted P-loop ATPase
MNVLNDYLALNFALIPLKPKSKLPIWSEWQKKASRSIDDWNQWLSEGYGLGCHLEDSNLIVIDIDVKNGGQGFHNWQEAVDELAIDLPHTLRVKTPSGGEHIFFRSIGKRATKIGSWKSGIDVKANGYVAVPPTAIELKPGLLVDYSVRAGYGLGDFTELPEFPQALDESIYPADAPIAEAFKLPPKIPTGQRDVTLFKMASSLVAQDMPPELISEAVKAANRKLTDTPQPEQEVERVIKNAEKYRDGDRRKKAEKLANQTKIIPIKSSAGVSIGAFNSKHALWESLGLVLTNQGKPQANMENCVRIIDGLSELKESIWFDDFRKCTLTVWRGSQREWSDNEAISLLFFFQREIGISTMKIGSVNEAVQFIANKYHQNEFINWIKSLTWDGTERIQRFFTDYMGAAKTDYALHISHNFWIGMVARGVAPGCQVDNMVVLEGEQGARKSSALRAIGDPWFSEIHGLVQNKDFLQAIQGKLLLEIGEMDSFNRSEVNLIKGMITNRVDRFRAPYERLPKDLPRTCVFIGTTNDDAYLKDVTGGRRFWPIAISKIDLDAIKRDRAQFFAEAFHQYKAGATWWHVTEVAKEEQEKRRQVDIWEAEIADYIAMTNYPEYETKTIAVDCLKIEMKDVDKQKQDRIAKCFRALGMKRRKSDGKVLWSK